MIFNNFKKVKVGYLVTHGPSIPKFLFQDLSIIIGCPATKSLQNRLFGLNPIISVTIKFGLNKDGEPYYNYEFDNKNFQVSDKVHQVIKETITVQKVNDVAAMQVFGLINLVTDDKDLEVTLLEPIDKNYNYCDFISGSFFPYGWIRSLNSSYIQTSDKEATVRLDVNTNMYRLFFNKPVDLYEVEDTDSIKKYRDKMHDITSYYKNMKPNLYKRIINKRPKYLLK